MIPIFVTMQRKSTTHPRPTLRVAPRSIGPIPVPNRNDVLCGRGGRVNAHEGNVQFRRIVASHRKKYLDRKTRKLEKCHIAALVVETVRMMDPPGRFLKEDFGSGLWFDIGDASAIRKAGQALRENCSGFRQDPEEETKGALPQKESGIDLPTCKGVSSQAAKPPSVSTSSLRQYRQSISSPDHASSMGSFPVAVSIMGAAQKPKSPNLSVVSPEQRSVPCNIEK